MKKILQIVAAVSFGFIALTASASAAESCVIENTGPESVNVCTNTTTRTCTVTNNNTITFTDDNSQVVASGSANGTNNTTVYNVSSGDATANNGSVVSVTVDNTVSGAQDCSVTTVTRTPVPQTPVATPAAPAAAAPVVKLPKTSSTSPLAFVGLGLMAAALIAVATRGVLAAQRATKQ